MTMSCTVRMDSALATLVPPNLFTIHEPSSPAPLARALAPSLLAMFDFLLLQQSTEQHHKETKAN